MSCAWSSEDHEKKPVQKPNNSFLDLTLYPAPDPHTHMPVVDLTELQAEQVDKHLQGLVSKAIEKAVGENLTCPITMELFVDPVFCAGDGHTYERTAILRHLESNTTSPVTRQELESTNIYPNFHARMLADLLRQAPAPGGRSNETQVVERKKDEEQTWRWENRPPDSDEEEDYTDEDESRESSESELEQPSNPCPGIFVFWNSRKVSFDYLREQRAAAEGIGHRNVHRDMSWGWGLDGYLGMLEDEDFSREDLEHSEEVEAGVWVDWEARVVRVHSAVRSALQTRHEERVATTLSVLRLGFDASQRIEDMNLREIVGRQDERVTTTLSSMRGHGGTGGVGL